MTQGERERRLESLLEALDLYVELGEAAPEAASSQDVRELVESMCRRAGGPGAPPGFERRLGDFVLRAEIGRGGMGIVYEAEQVSLRRRVAVKVLPASGLASPRALARFRREAKAIAALDHPCIVRIFASGRAGDVEFFAMERVHGVPLDGVLRVLAAQEAPPTRAADAQEVVAAQLDEAREPGREPDHSSYAAWVARIGLDVASALGHAHAQGVLHRDVKPSNVLVRLDGHAVLTDFGLARDLNEPGLSVSGDLAGTPYYLAPEVVRRGQTATSAASDVFALGAMLYEMLVLRRPFEADTVAGVLDAVTRVEPVDPRRLREDLPVDLCAVVLRALEKEPERRYPSAEALAADLRAFLELRPVRARLPGRRERVLRWMRREPLRAGLLGAAGLAAVLAGGFGAYVVTTSAERAAGEASLRRRSVDRWLVRGFGALRHLEFEAARRAFEAALSIDPRCPEALLGLALRREPAAGAALLASHAEALRASPALARAYEILRSAARLGTLSSIAETVSKAAPRTAMESHLLALLALELAERGDRAAARHACDLLRRAVVLAPRARELYFVEWLRAAFATGEAERIAAVAEMAELSFPDSAGVQFWLAFAAQDPEEALRRMERAVAADPTWAFAWANLAARRQVAGDVHGAEAAARRAIALDPERTLGWLNLGTALSAQDRDHEAVDAYLEAVRLAPRFVPARLYLGDLQLHLGDAEAAARTFRKACELAPDQAMPHKELARALSALGDREGALRSLRAALARDPADEEAKRYLETLSNEPIRDRERR